ncbi:hypothetical protein A3E39_02730 [Candidatus Uhrbacteria bacterium RIFCSPHIGHO2_12_FULL_60_25]|uniref:Uncharacterized protein n=1 Tax=Candidatus Uhrbacteria bacterium RIFCSPHIGHO2_12_FULL_60_25 TaxID=1802399 RepID=A0A1F7UJE5_9BACT|nr:MAG: hypothetical protein A3D73_03755 [Candidatus Uhrbacteria bacterium RIFCSPHIGHO2_02_FULL_60_44]OGL78392.1 MAG: hypothetical protein A3E39_02730 [Candidatus Uhrbacteria bacterium RIFCSPHIGHO2_12_FULL_60_25]
MRLCEADEIDAENELTSQAAAFLRSNPTTAEPIEASGVFSREDHRLPTWMLEVEHDLARTG